MSEREAVRADDALLDALRTGSAIPAGQPGDAEVARLLAAWRADVDAEPVPTLVEVDAAVRALEEARRG